MRTLRYEDGVITMIDQTALPHEEVWLELDDVGGLVAAIRRLSVRGAPALGVAGAYGVAIAARHHDPRTDPDGFTTAVDGLRAARPTAVNLAHGVDRVVEVARTAADPVGAAEAEADRIRDEELAASISMGELGAGLIAEWFDERPVRVMTVCNTGGLASLERGTALAVVQTLHEHDRIDEVLPLETRPLLQGGRLTTWELARMGAPHRLVVDSAGPFLLARGAADVVLIGADRIAANGDTANKIGSFSLALAARHAEVPFLVVAPESTIDHRTATGAGIEIEDRGAAEVVGFGATRVAPEGTAALNPAFDVTPAELVTAIVTDARVTRVADGDTP
ncbi:MAG: S-methyl-5-thioribose-1-phosphate isomerase [Actinomycetota bacterium]